MTTKERDAAWAKLEAAGWRAQRVLGDAPNWYVTLKHYSCGVYHTRNEAIDYALQLAQKQEK